MATTDGKWSTRARCDIFIGGSQSTVHKTFAGKRIRISNDNEADVMSHYKFRLHRVLRKSNSILDWFFHGFRSLSTNYKSTLCIYGNTTHTLCQTADVAETQKLFVCLRRKPHLCKENEGIRERKRDLSVNGIYIQFTTFYANKKI